MSCILVEYKHCPRCLESKAIDEFPLNKARSDGHAGYCRPCQNEAQAEYTQALRLAALTLLGACCVRCGIHDLRVLCFDHVSGGGGKLRRTGGSQTLGNGLYRRIIAGEPGFQILCWNCNFIKRMDEGEHKGDRVYLRGVTSAEARKIRLTQES